MLLLLLWVASVAWAAVDRPYALGAVPTGGRFVVESLQSKHETLRTALTARGWRELRRVGAAASYGFKWTFSHNRLHVPSERTVLNHYANFTAFTSKRGLLLSLRASGRDVSSFVPRAYLVPSELAQLHSDHGDTIARCNASERTAQPAIDCGPTAHGALWIAKPAAGTRGVGIFVWASWGELVAQLAHNPAGPELVVQKYVERPLLVFGRKFDLRQFVLVTSLNPLTVFVSDDCYVRFSSAPYNASNLDPLIHLTNHQVQKHHIPAGDAALGIHGNQWPLASLKRHLGFGAWDAVVKPRIDRLIARTVAAWPARQQSHRAMSFELLGFDIMLDDNLHPWLMEVNSDPGLHLLTPVVNAHHERAVLGLLETVLDRRTDWEDAPTDECLLASADDDALDPAPCPRRGPLVGVWQLRLKMQG